ncbi:hypothetical protein TNCV_2838021 [Trichonephila clavipes]|nr:hypothetical protein TNCV_2838021 [Trichonephila clavipes]
MRRSNSASEVLGEFKDRRSSICWSKLDQGLYGRYKDCQTVCSPWISGKRDYSGCSVKEHNPFQEYLRYPNCSLTDHRFTIDFYVKSINSFWRP